MPHRTDQQVRSRNLRLLGAALVAAALTIIAIDAYAIRSNDASNRSGFDDDASVVDADSTGAHATQAPFAFAREAPRDERARSVAARIRSLPSSASDDAWRLTSDADSDTTTDTWLSDDAAQPDDDSTSR